MESVCAKVEFRHLRTGSRVGRGYTEDVKRFIRSLDGFREGDEIGHIIGDALGGPSGRRYNFFPQSSRANKVYWNAFEKKIREFLKEQNDRNHYNAYVKIRVEFFYNESNKNRPVGFKYLCEYSDGTVEYFDFYNSP